MFVIFPAVIPNHLAPYWRELKAGYSCSVDGHCVAEEDYSDV